MDVSAVQPLVTSHVATSNQTRLDRIVQSRLGLHRLDNRERATFFRQLVRGLYFLSEFKPHAESWALEFEKLVEPLEVQSLPASIAASQPNLHPLVSVVIGQPAPNRNSAQRKACLTTGALAVIDVVFNNASLHSNFCSQLRQLYRSNAASWSELLALNWEDPPALKSWIPNGNSKTVLEFKDRLLALQDIAIPSVLSFLDAPNILHKGSATQSGSTLHPEPTVISPVKAPPLKVDPMADLTPRLDLFEVQKQRDCQADIVDGFRLPLKWERLDPAELRISLRHLNTHLKVSAAPDANARHQQVHAAVRYVSLFAGVSLKKCLRLPLGRRGSMKLDIAQGVIRRDLRLVAPRMDMKDRVRVNGRWWRTRLPLEVAAVLRQMLARHPRARSLGDLVKAEGLTYELCQNLLNASWPMSHRPEDGRFANSLRPALLELGIHPALVSRITGDTMTTPASDHYYLSFSEDDVHKGVVIFCEFAELTAPAAPLRNRTIGSPKQISVEHFRSINETLNQQVLKRRVSLTTRSSLKDILEFHNFYSCAVALQILWSVGGRCDRTGSLTFERMFASDDYIAISDRRVDRYSRQRIVPITECIAESRTRYLEHLRAMAVSIEGFADQNTTLIASLPACTRSHHSAFTIFFETPLGWQNRSLKRKDLVALASSLGVQELNTPRHFWFAQLVSLGVAQVAIEALMGHHINGAEAFGYASGISLREVSEYLRPILASVQKSAGFAPLAGRGRQSARYLKLPDFAVRKNLRHLPNFLLKKKLAAEDFLIREVGIYEQDPPSDCKTLIAHSQLSRLQKLYLSTAICTELPLGALLFCLIGFDLVLTPLERDLLLTAALSDGAWRIGQMAVIEGCREDGRPLVQRIVSPNTIAAVHQARKLQSSQDTIVGTALNQLHLLLSRLTPNWKSDSPMQSTDLLTSLAGHWAAVEIPAGTLFGVFHKAPFLPVQDLSRLFFRKPCAPEQWDVAEQRNAANKGKKSFEKTLDIVNKWGNKDLPLGEEVARSKGCLLDLQARRAEGDANETEQVFIDLLCADLSPHAPYRQLKITTLPEYARGYDIYFSFVQTEGTFELDAESWHEIYTKMGGPKDFKESGPVRWQMLHICSFLHQIGIWAPPAFISEKGIKQPTMARLPVYTSAYEIASAQKMIDRQFQHLGGTYQAAGLRLQLQREAPVRVSEPRYCRPADVDPTTGIFHVTSSGHDHLKSSYSRGSVQLSPQLASEMASFRKRKLAIDVGSDTLLFADAHLDSAYGAFEATSDAIRDAISYLTGRKRFRQHDLRCAAITDACFSFEFELARLANSLPLSRMAPCAQDISIKHRRFAWGSRLGRHASTLTTLRHYNCGGVLDLAHHLRLAHSGLEVTAGHLAAISGVKAQTLYAANHRAHSRRPQASTDRVLIAPVQTRHQKFVDDIVQFFRTPDLVDLTKTSDCTTSSTMPASRARRLVEAGLLCISGFTVESASDATQIPTEFVADLMSQLTHHMKHLGIPLGRTDKVPILSSKLGSHHRRIERVLSTYAAWLVTNQSAIQAASISLISCISRSSGTGMDLKSELQLTTLLPVLRGASAAGFHIVFNLGDNRLVSQMPMLDKALVGQQILIHPDKVKKDILGTVRFLMPKEKTLLNTRLRRQSSVTDQEVLLNRSPRAYGLAGGLAIGGLLLGLTLHSSKG